MRHWRLWGILALIVVLASAGGFAWWNYELRWRPQAIEKHQAEIAKILESSGWVSPGAGGAKLYMVSYSGCLDCLRFKSEQLPDLRAAGVDTRIIEIARRDENGQPRSTPAERSTVAELWLGRSWTLFQQWGKAPPEAWKAPGIPAADGDMARTAVVEAGRKMVDDLTPLLADNGVRFAYPLLIWWTKDGEMRGCTCEKRQTYRFVRKELGVKG